MEEGSTSPTWCESAPAPNRHVRPRGGELCWCREGSRCRPATILLLLEVLLLEVLLQLLLLLLWVELLLLLLLLLLGHKRAATCRGHPAATTCTTTPWSGAALVWRRGGWRGEGRERRLVCKQHSGNCLAHVLHICQRLRVRRADALQKDALPRIAQVLQHRRKRYVAAE